MLDERIEKLKQSTQRTLISNLGIVIKNITDTTVEASMPVDFRTKQPAGLLHGGASIALAETVSSIGSFLMCGEGERCVGMQVSANHVSSSKEGDTVLAIAKIMHKGKSTHLWNIDVISENTGKIISTVRIINSIIQKENK